MDIDNLLKSLAEEHGFENDFIRSLKREISVVSLPKNYILLDGLGVSQTFFFMASGIAASYCYIEGKKYVTTFWMDGDLILSIKSFFFQVPAGEFIQLLDDSELFCISYESFDRLQNSFPAARRLSISLCSELFQRERNRSIDFQRLSTKGRYQAILKAYPGIEGRVSQDLIASYLGISPPALSRLKTTIR